MVACRQEIFGGNLLEKSLAYGQKSIFNFNHISIKYFLRSRNIFKKISPKDF